MRLIHICLTQITTHECETHGHNENKRCYGNPISQLFKYVISNDLSETVRKDLITQSTSVKLQARMKRYFTLSLNTVILVSHINTPLIREGIEK